ncbi:Collagen alpha-1(XXV) chain [Liparis tanakae]|uniref:Collagen alpha-1(XXV) chain n=1 Tax=Liparis tanakae TaxID=230148 RepID=A0A4Z2J363_9TELE|nr:Collagen alpha-1(XXV) chain [Liparis tanakae]
METAEARGASKCAEKMEKEVAPQKRHYYRTALLNIISSLCSVASVAFCILLSINAADVNNRVLHLETGNGEHSFLRAPGYSMDDFNSLIGQRVDELLSQRSYENLVKIRTARQTSPECNCPPGEDCNVLFTVFTLLLSKKIEWFEEAEQWMQCSSRQSWVAKPSTKDASQTLGLVCWVPSDTGSY